MVLGCPKPLEYTNSVAYQFFDLSGLTNPLRDGLNLSSSLVLDATFGQLGPLSSFCFFFFASLSSSLFCLLSSILPLRVSSILCHGFKAIRAHGCSIPLPPPSDSLLQLRLEFPVSASSSGSYGVDTCPPATAPACFVALVFPLHRGMSHPPPWRSNQTSNSYSSWLNPLSIPAFPSGTISAVRSGASRSNAIHTFHTVDLLDR